jgi:hypothetical protein
LLFLYFLPSIRPSVHPSLRPSARLSVCLSVSYAQFLSFLRSSSHVSLSLLLFRLPQILKLQIGT